LSAARGCPHSVAHARAGDEPCFALDISVLWVARWLAGQRRAGEFGGALGGAGAETASDGAGAVERGAGDGEAGVARYECYRITSPDGLLLGPCHDGRRSLAIYAAVYQPQVAILGLTEAPEFAQVARLMAMNDPKLQTIIPSHIRPRAAILSQAQQELDRLGLGGLLFMPELRRIYEYWRSADA
jgi:hypothetical protein